MADLPPSSSETRLTESAASAADASAGPGGAGEGHHVDAGVGRRAPRRRRPPCRRRRCRRPPARRPRRRSRRSRRAESGATSLGLWHHRAAGRERRRDLGDRLVQRVVPRSDRGDDADRLGDDGGVADVPDLLRRAQKLHIGVEHPQGQPDLDRRRDAGRGAHLGGDGGGHEVGAGGEAVADRAQVRGALGATQPGPAGERLARGTDGPVDIRRVARRHLADNRGGGWVLDRDASLPEGRDPRAADEVHVRLLSVPAPTSGRATSDVYCTTSAHYGRVTAPAEYARRCHGVPTDRPVHGPQRGRGRHRRGQRNRPGAGRAVLRRRSGHRCGRGPRLRGRDAGGRRPTGWCRPRPRRYRRRRCTGGGRADRRRARPDRSVVLQRRRRQRRGSGRRRRLGPDLAGARARAPVRGPRTYCRRWSRAGGVTCSSPPPRPAC